MRRRRRKKGALLSAHFLLPPHSLTRPVPRSRFCCHDDWTRAALPSPYHPLPKYFLLLSPLSLVAGSLLPMRILQLFVVSPRGSFRNQHVAANKRFLASSLFQGSIGLLFLEKSSSLLLPRIQCVASRASCVVAHELCSRSKNSGSHHERKLSRRVTSSSFVYNILSKLLSLSLYE